MNRCDFALPPVTRKCKLVSVSIYSVRLVNENKDNNFI